MTFYLFCGKRIVWHQFEIYEKKVRKVAKSVEEIINETINQAISIYLKEQELSPDVMKSLTGFISERLSSNLSLVQTKEKLELLFQYERNYLSLIKEFKEEIKFAATIQEDLRKERAKFFSEVLDDVSSTMKKSQISEHVADQWIKELVASYTKSLDVSADLLNDETMESFGKLTQESISEKRLIEMRDEK